MEIALFINENGLPIAVPGVHACAHALKMQGFHVRLFDFFQEEPVTLLADGEAPGVVVLWRSNSFDCQLPQLDAWLPGFSERARAIKKKLPETRVVLAGWLEYFKEELATALPDTGFDAAFISGYDFALPLVEWLAQPVVDRPVVQWPERSIERKRTLDGQDSQYPWPGRFLMATPPVCDRLCRKCEKIDACPRMALDGQNDVLAAMLADFQSEVSDCADTTRYIYVATLDIGHTPAVLEAVRDAAQTHPHLKWFLALSLHAGLPEDLLELLSEIPLGGLELFCPSFNPESMAALGLQPLELLEACKQVAERLPEDTYLEVCSYIGLPGDTPESLEQTWGQLNGLTRVDNLNLIPLFLDTGCRLYKEGYYTLTPQTPQSLFGLPGWKTAHLDSEWLRAWLEQKRPALPRHTPLVANVFWLQFMFHLVMNGFTPAELRSLRRQVQEGQLEAAQAQIERQGHATQRAFFNWMTAEKVAAAQ